MEPLPGLSVFTWFCLGYFMLKSSTCDLRARMWTFPGYLSESFELLLSTD